MQWLEAQRLVTDVYNIISSPDEDIFIREYMCTEEKIHDAFWGLHHRLSISKGNLRNALNRFAESAEQTISIIEEIRILIDRDKENKKALKYKRKKEIEEEKGNVQDISLDLPLMKEN